MYQTVGLTMRQYFFLVCEKIPYNNRLEKLISKINVFASKPVCRSKKSKTKSGSILFTVPLFVINNIRQKTPRLFLTLVSVSTSRCFVHY